MAVLVKELLIFYLIMINNRVEFIDYTKGIAILLMIISHCVVGYGPLKTWISSFNMPIFFVICGYLCYLKHPQGISLSRSTSYLKKRVLNLWKPYIIFCFILIAFFNALKFLSGASTTILPQIKNVIFLYGIESMWFLPVYFFSEFLFLLITKELSLIKNTFLVISIIFTFIISGENFISGEFIQIKRCLVAYIFIYIGYICGRYEIFFKFKSYPLLLLVLITLFSVSSIRLGFSTMGFLNNPFLYFINGSILCISILSILNRILVKTNLITKTLKYYGTNTIIILGTNNLLIEIIRLFDFYFTNNYLLNNGIQGGILFSFIIILLEIPFIELIKGKL